MASKGMNMLPLSMGLCIGVVLVNEFGSTFLTFTSACVSGGVLFPYNRTNPNVPYLRNMFGEKRYPAIPEKKAAA